MSSNFRSLTEQADLDPCRVHPQWGVFDLASAKPEQGFGPCLWNVEANKQFKHVPENGAKTLVEILEKSKDSFADRSAVGWRQLLHTHEVDEGGAKREKLEYANSFDWLTYAQYFERMVSVAKGFAALGVVPKSKVVIYAETQPDWLLSAFAAWYNNAQIVTIYATLGEEGAIHGINETEATTVVVDAKLLKILVKILPKCKSIKSIIAMSECDPVLVKKVTDASVGMRTMEETIELGKTSEFSPSKPTPEDVAVIMYTSGTTGPPKGVIMLHSNIVATVAGVQHGTWGMVNQETKYLCYLPLAHVMEMAAELCFLSFGAACGYGTPHTLTDTGVKLKRPESMGDAPCLSPTFMVFAPAVLDKIYQAIQARKNSLGRIGQTLFNWGLTSGSRHFDNGRVGANGLYNAVLFKKVQKLVGGSLSAMITGSAPLSPDIQRFIQTVLCAPVRQGYGLTETCAGSCVGYWGDNTPGSVGPPTVCTVIRLADWPEGNYLNADKDKPGVMMPRGEVLIGGPTVTVGYYINPAMPNPEMQTKNEEDWVTIDDIRFFRTGDVAQVTPTGCIQIIDRKKDLWKGPQGEYVALTKVEAALKLCGLVEMPMCYGKTGGEYPVALICPQKRPLEALAVELGVTGTFAELCLDQRIVDRVSKDCTAKCKEQRLVAFEIPTKYALISDLWTPENDMLTAAMKLKRPIIVEKHRAAVDALYA